MFRETWMYRRDECSVFGDRDGSIRLMALRSLSRVSCADFDVASCVACQNLCGASASQVVYLAVFETGCQSWVEDTSVRSCRVFYGHFNDIPAQKLKDLQIYRGRFCNFLKTWEFVNLRKLCKKTKSQIFASGFGLFSLYISIYVPVLSELQHLSFRRILQFETMLQWREKRQLGRENLALKKASMYPVNDYHWTEVVG